MTRLQRLLGAILVGVFILGVAVLGGVVSSDRSTTEAVGRNEIAANGTVQGRLYPGDPETEAGLVDREAERVGFVRSVAATVPWRIPGADGAYRVPTTPLSTLVLPAREEPYTLDDLRALAPDTFVDEGDGRYLLSEHVLVLPGARFSLAAGSPVTIEMQSDAEGFASFVSLGADLDIVGTEEAPVTFISRAGGPGAPDTDTSDGRAYVRVIGGPVDVRYARFADLGFWSGNTGGFSLTGLDTESGADALPELAEPADGAAGAAGATILAPDQLEALATDEGDPGGVTGSLQHVESDGNAFGLFVSRASELAISDSNVRAALVDGIVLHRYVSDTSVSSTESTGNAVDGLAVERSSSRLDLTGLVVGDNGRNGVSIDGRPLADGPSAQGTDVSASGEIRLTDAKVTGNARYGVEVNGGEQITVADSTIAGNEVGLVLDHRARTVAVRENVFEDQPRAIAVRRAVDDARVVGNEITTADTGVHVRSSSVLIEDNRISDVSNHAVTVAGSAEGTRVHANEIAGYGTTAIHVDGSRATISGNDTEAWSPPVTTTSVVQTLSQPLSLIWAALGLLLLFTALTGRRRRGTRNPYAERVPLTALSRGIVPAEQLKKGTNR
ncbi:right-handed parallel beta-helix repeat-containing protein [Agromyces sp. GXS1127]|uniref:right-handed parallel beta-helix repeat-containing protein n=1 Tax=Agromyces sp. GXS1127 TaxID=3424181 RepID=UPI003D3201F5